MDNDQETTDLRSQCRHGFAPHQVLLTFREPLPTGVIRPQGTRLPVPDRLPQRGSLT